MKRRHLIVIALSLLFAPIYRNLACEVAGDIYCDGKIDHNDVTALCDQWLQTPAESEPNADLNLDGKIDFTDFSIMAGGWGGDENWPGEKSGPEPNGPEPNEPEPNWVVYPGYEAAVRQPICSYDGNIICVGYYDTGIQFFNGTSYFYGAKPNYDNIQQAWGLTRSFDIGVLLQTINGILPELEYTATPYSGNFIVVSPSRFRKDPNSNMTQLHRSAVDCGEINDIDIGIIAQWKFDEQNETSGTDSVADSSGNDNNLTPNAQIVSVNSANPATMNTAIDFDGNNQYMRVAGSGLEPTGDFTVCFWMKLNDISEGGKTIIVQGTSGGRCIEAQGSKLRVFLDHDGDTDACALSDDGYLSAAEWDFYSIIYTAADDNISFYKNGNKPWIWNITQGSGTLVNYSSSDFYIGGSPDGNLMNGQLDNVMVFNRALTGNQIKILYSGRPDGSGAGTQDLNRLRRVVLYFEYGGAGRNAWFSRDDCLTWTRMWDANATGISHFHGGIFEPNVGDKGRLYVFTGDSPASSSILICDDINDLLTNREAWYNRWALGAGQRTNWTPDSNYVLGWNDEKWRTTDMVSDGNYGYWMPDNSAVSDIVVRKIRHSDKKLTTLATCPQVKGYGWIGLYTSKGDVIFATTTSITRNNTFDSCGVDEWVRLYQIKKDDSVVELNKWRIAVYNPFVNPVIAPSYVAVIPNWLSELNGIIFMYGRNIEPYDLSSLGSLNCPILAKAGSIGHAYPDFNIIPMTNRIINGTFDNGFNSWIKSGSGWSIDSEVTEGGHSHSAKCVVSYGNPCIKQYIWANNLPIGSFVTVKVKMRVASGADYGFMPAIFLDINDSGVVSTYISLANSSSSTALADNSWHEFWASLFIRPDTWYICVYLYPSYGWGDGTIYLSDVRIESGRAFGYQHF